MQYRQACAVKAKVLHTEARRTTISELLRAFKQAAKSKDLESGKKLHASAVETGNDKNAYVTSSLINMYAKCGSLEDARKLFDKFPRQDVFTWTALVTGYVDNGEAGIALKLFTQMKSSECDPNGHTFVAALKACWSLATKEVGKCVGETLVKVAALEQGMAIHEEAAKRSCIDMFVANALVEMYARCGSLWDARMTFDRMPSHDVVSWTSLVWGYAQNGKFESALQLFSCMTGSNLRCPPNSRSFVVAIKACSSMAANKELKSLALETGRKLHLEAAKWACDSDIAVRSCMIEMYFKCDSLKDAENVFYSAASSDVVLWNAMLLGYAQSDTAEATFEVLERMQSMKMPANSQTFLAALKACTSIAARGEADSRMMALVKAGEIHVRASKDEFVSDILVASGLIDTYAKCGEMREAQRIFHDLKQRDVVVWTSLIQGYLQNGQPELALQLYEEMLETGNSIPDSHCIAAALKACACLAANNEASRVLSLEKGLAISSHAENAGCDSELLVGAILVDMFSRFGSMDKARDVFIKLRKPDAACWTSLLLGYSQNGQSDVAVEVFYRMQLEGCLPATQTYIAVFKACASFAANEESQQINGKRLKVLSLTRSRALRVHAAATGFLLDEYVASTLIDLFAKCGSMVDALSVFSATQTKTKSNVVAWTALILGYVHNSESEAALQTFAEMELQSCCQPDAQILAAVLKACSDSGTAQSGRKAHALILRNGFESSAAVSNSLVDLYAKCSMLENAQRTFDSLPASASIQTWTALLGGFSRQGDVDRVFDLLREMEESGLKPDGVTSTFVLAACSHAGLVDKGLEFFELMSSRYGVEVELEHYHGMVDLFGRANRLEQALEVIRSMPIESTTATWMTLLSACHKWNNLEIAKVAFQKLLELDEDHPAAHVVMANIFSSNEKVET